MSKYLLFTCILFFSIQETQGQTVITVNSAFVVGDLLSQQPTDTSADEGPAGAGQAWDFSSVPKVGPIVSIPVVATSSTGYQAFYPNADMAIDNDGENFTFLNTTDSTMEIAGVVIDGKSFVYDNREIIFKYPFSYATAFADTFSGTYSLDDVTVNRSGTCSFLCDANGTLIMPTGVVSSTLRIKFIEKITDVAHYGNIVVTTITNSTSYFWMIPTNKNPLVKITYTSTTANGITTETEDDYYYVSFVSTEDISPIINKISFYPNPSSEYINVSFLSQEDGLINLSIENYLGKNLKNFGSMEFTKGKNAVSLQIDELPAGCYLLRMDVENNSPLVVKFLKE